MKNCIFNVHLVSGKVFEYSFKLDYDSVFSVYYDNDIKPVDDFIESLEDIENSIKLRDSMVSFVYREYNKKDKKSFIEKKICLNMNRIEFFEFFCVSEKN